MKIELNSIGLTDKEAGAYLALVEYGTKPTSFIARKAGLNRGTAYTILHQLLEKGFATKTERNNAQFFTALEPSKIPALLQRRRDSIDQQIKQSQDLVNQLTQLSSPQLSKPKVQLFSGQEGARTAMLESLGAREENLRAFLSIHDMADFLGAEFFENYTQQRIAAGPYLRAIRDHTKDQRAFATNPYAHGYKTSVTDRREVRYLTKPLEFPMSLYLFDDQILGLSSKAESFAFMLRSADLSTMLKSLFDMLWEGARAE